MDMDDPSLTAWLAAIRAVHFACCLLVGGVWAFDRLVAAGTPGWRRLATGLLWTATPIAFLSGAAWLVVVAADMGDVPVGDVFRSGVMRTVWTQTRFGTAWQVHAAFWVAGVISLTLWSLTGRGRWPGLACAGGLVGGLAWAGHGSTGPAPVWHMTADVTHLLASAVWPAGLVPFALLLRRVAAPPDPDRRAVVHRLTRRFSAASLTAVALLTATGLLNSWCLLGSIGNLLTTPYGRMLLVKLVLFTTMVGLGAFNLLVLSPRLPNGDAAVGHLRVTVTVEMVLGVGVIVAVGLLGMMEPGRQ
jgi:putative copper resistance protein D